MHVRECPVGEQGSQGSLAPAANVALAIGTHQPGNGPEGERLQREGQLGPVGSGSQGLS